MPRRRGSAQDSGFTVLVVDDQEEALISTELLLKREGHQVLTAPGGREALALFKANHIDLVIVDYFMPGMSGEDLIEAIRKIDGNIQILLQTGYSGEKPPLEMLKRLEIQGYHDKSEGPERLLVWIEVALKAASQLARIIENERRLGESEAELRKLSRRLIATQEEERERISRELHDELGQLLTAAALDIDWARTRGHQEPAGLAQRLEEASELIRKSIRETRELCAELRPGDLKGERLVEALKAHVSEFARRSSIELRLSDTSEAPAFSAETSRHIYRIVQEALSNIARHSQARQMSIALARNNGNFKMNIADDGRGFDLAKVTDPHAVGLVGMRERARLIGADLQIQSSEGAGTRIEFEVPIEPVKMS